MERGPRQRGPRVSGTGAACYPTCVESVDLHLVDPNVLIYEALSQAFKGTSVHVHFDYFEELDDDGLENAVLVSAANSFGLMDGGVDAAITAYFGDQLQRRVQARIRHEYYGEQPVGTSFIIRAWPDGPRADESGYRWLAHTPTMRVPARIAHTDNVYLAFKAMLTAVYQYNKIGRQREAPADLPRIENVVCPGLGTGVGAVPPEEAARQMRVAYSHFHSVPEVLDWSYARKVQDSVNGTGGMRV